MMNTYWNNNGKFQNEYNELELDGKWTKAEENAKYKYYRYYNDGDIPAGAKYFFNHTVEEYLEEQASIAIAKAYCRAHKGERIDPVVVEWSQRPLQGFSAWYGR